MIHKNYLLMFTLTLLVCAGQVSAQQLVTIPDANLRAVIEKRLGKASGASITPAEMASLTRLDAPNANISDLTGLEFASGLTRLHLFNNNISDLSALSGLTNLTWISLGRNRLSDVSALSNLTNMTRLGFDYNGVSDVSALSGMTGLTELYLRGNSISDLSPLVANTGLGSGDRVDVRDNPLSIASHATHIPALQNREVRVQFTAPQSVSIPNANLRAIIADSLDKARGASITPDEMASLTHLRASNSNISDLTGLEFASGLTVLALSSNSISDVSALSGLTNLTQLSLSSNSISDVSALSGLINLRVLLIQGNNISDLSPLVENTGLDSEDGVDVRDNPLSGKSILTHIPALDGRGVTVQFDTPQLVTIPDANLRAAIETALGKARGASITPAEMASLTRLDAPNSNISDLTGLEFASGLTRLHLFTNNISDLSALSGLTNLTWISLGRNRISDVSALSNLTNMTRLGFDYNSVSDVSALSGMTDLTELYLRGNSISDLSPLVANTGLDSGDRVDVRDNPLSIASHATHIPALQNRRVEISFDPPPLVKDYDADNDGLIEISSLAQLDAIRYDLDGDGVLDSGQSTDNYDNAFPNASTGMGCPSSGCIGYELTANLDFDTNGNGDADAGDAYWNNGAGWVPIGDFQTPYNATFDGSGHTIDNLYIDRKEGNIGLFGGAGSNSIIKKVGLLSINVTGGRVGGLVGQNYGTITESYTIGSVSGDDGNGVGGLVGYNYGPVTDSYVIVSLSVASSVNVGGLIGGNWSNGVVTASYSASSISGGNNAGGLVGGNGGTVTASYSTGSVSSNGNHIGGLIGYNGGAITASYSTSSVTGSGIVGSLVGRSDGTTTVSYWNTQFSGQTVSAGGEGKTTRELQSPTSNTGIYAAWDNAVWDLGTSSQYPALKNLGRSLVEQRQFHLALTVHIPDANLRAVIEDSLGKARGAPITPDEMASLTRFDAPNKNIRDLTGLEFATNLTELRLDFNNNLSDISLSLRLNQSDKAVFRG